MAYDTIKLKSPAMSREFIRAVEQKCILRSGVDMATGEMIYELHTGQLLGSWDARISVVPKYDDWVSDKNGTPRLHACEPYLMVEASIHKVMLGHNVYGGPTKFLDSARYLVNLVAKLLEVELPVADVWTVHRVDVGLRSRREPERRTDHDRDQFGAARDRLQVEGADRLRGFAAVERQGEGAYLRQSADHDGAAEDSHFSNGAELGIYLFRTRNASSS